jgi:hypothetical protein
MLPVVLYGCETWSLTLTKEHILKVSENVVLRRTSEPKGDEITEGWRRLLEEEICNLYSFPCSRMIKSRRIR